MKKFKTRSKFYSKNILACLLLILVLAGCQKEEKPKFYDKVLYYHKDFYNIPPPPDGTKEFEIHYYDFVHENNKSKYENLSQYGYKEYQINDEFSLKIDDFFTNQNPGPYASDYKCLSCFQDILVFIKKEKSLVLQNLILNVTDIISPTFLQISRYTLKKNVSNSNIFLKIANEKTINSNRSLI